MNNKSLKLLVSVALIFLSACQTVPYDAHKKIEAEGNFVTRTFYPGELTQGEKSVGVFDVISNLKMKPATEPTASSAQLWTYTSWGLAGLGVVLVGVGIFQSSSSNLLLGAVAVGGGVGAAYFADNRLMESIQIHNSEGPKKKKHGWLDFDFNLKVARAGTSENQRLIPVLGLNSDF